MKPAISTLPKGAISEVFGSVSCGKTALLHSFLAEAAGGGECGCVIDVLNTFDPLSAAQAGIDLRRILWVRGKGGGSHGHIAHGHIEGKPRIDHAFKSVDMILHGGGFGVVVLDLSGVQPRDLNRIPLSYWYRFRLAVQNTPTRLLVVADVPIVKSCARLQLEAKRESILWNGSQSGALSKVFGGLDCAVEPRKTRVVPVVTNVVTNVITNVITSVITRDFKALPLAG